MCSYGLKLKLRRKKLTCDVCMAGVFHAAQEERPDQLPAPVPPLHHATHLVPGRQIQPRR